MSVSRFRQLLVALLPCALALRPSAQALYREVRPVETPRVWTVDDSGGADFTDLPLAVANARSGDVLLVAAGVYSGFVLRDKGLTILGDGAVPRIVGSVSAIGLSAGEELVLRSLEIMGNQSDVRLEDNAGTVWIEDCSLVGLTQSDPEFVSAFDCAAVVMMRTAVLAGDATYPSAAQAQAFLGVRSEIHVYSSDLQGQNILALVFLAGRKEAWACGSRIRSSTRLPAFSEAAAEPARFASAVPSATGGQAQEGPG